MFRVDWRYWGQIGDGLLQHNLAFKLSRPWSQRTFQGFEGNAENICHTNTIYHIVLLLCQYLSEVNIKFPIVVRLFEPLIIEQVYKHAASISTENVKHTMSRHDLIPPLLPAGE